MWLAREGEKKKEKGANPIRPGTFRNEMADGPCPSSEGGEEGGRRGGYARARRK